MSLPDALLDLLRRPSPCFLSTLMPDGSPQMTQTWVDTDGHDVLINTVRGHQKVRNVERDPRATVAQVDGRRWLSIAGRAVVERDRSSIVLISADTVGRELAPRLAYRMQAALATECVDLGVDDARPVVKRQV